jgi:hypothetical protein
MIPQPFVGAAEFLSLGADGERLRGRLHLVPQSDGRQTLRPPSTESTAPVVNGESSEAKKAMEVAISAGVA